MAHSVSMSGLDLSFMKDKPKRRRGGKKKATGWQAQMDAIKAATQSLPSKRADIAAPLVMTDIKPFVSPIDGKEITSRSKLRAHERTHNVRQAGDFKKGELIERENKRVAETRRLAQGAETKWL